MSGSSGPALSRRAAVELAQALVEHVAAEQSVRVLALKGPVLAQHGLRTAQPSSDADVLVRPGDQAALRRGLEERGWQERFEREMPAILERHSCTLLHAAWPVDIDVHWYFPGLHAEPEEVFEALWDHRERIELAHREVTCLDLPASALVAAVHCARYPRSRRRQRELAQVVERIAPEPSVVSDVAALARRTRSLSVLGPFFRDLGHVVDGDLTDAERDRWSRYVGTHEWGSTGAWLDALGRGPVRGRARTIRRALWPDRAELVRMHTPAIDRPAQDLGARRRMVLRVGRWRRALAALVPTLRALRRRS